MEYVGRKVTKNVGGRGACFGSVESYSPATGLFKVVYDGGDSEEMGLAEVSPLLIAPPRSSIGERGAVEGSSRNSAGGGGNPPAQLFDLNICEIDLTDDGEGAGGLGGLHGLDLNEGVNYILHEDLDSDPNPNPKRKMIDLNLEAVNEEDDVEERSAKRARLFDLNVELKEDEVDDADLRRGKQAVAAEDRPVMAPPANFIDVDVARWRQTGESSSSNMEAVAAEDRPVMAPPNFIDVDATAATRWRPTEESSSSSSNMEDLRRHILMARMPYFSVEQYYSLLSAGLYSHFRIPFPPLPITPAAPLVDLLPPKVELPPSSACLDLKGASLLDFLSVYSFLRSFSVSLLISPFQIEEFASSVISNDSTSLFDAVHLSLLTTLRRNLESLSDEGSVSASLCLRSLNWDFLDSITWPVFLFEYLTFHSPKYIPGLAQLSKEDAFEPFQSDYYTMPASAKIAILQHLCDDVVESEACRSEINRRGAMAESHNWKSRYFSCKVVKKAADGASTSYVVEEYTNEFEDDGNGDECYLCRTDGNLICCDGCPAAFHAKCVGVAASLLPEGNWFCPECTFDEDKASLTKSVRGLELVGPDPHGRIYYACCQYLLVSDSCNDEYSFLLYKGDDVAAVIAALESCSSSRYDKIISAIHKHWSSVNHLCSGQDTFPESRVLSAMHSTLLETTNVEVPTSGNVVSVPGEIAALDEGKMENPILPSSEEGSAEISVHLATETPADPSSEEGKIGFSILPSSKAAISPGTDTTLPEVGTSTFVNPGDGSEAPVIITTGQGDDDQMTANDGGSETVAQESHEPCYVNSYEFARTASSCSKELASKLSAEDATRSAEQIMALQMRIISNRYASCSWSNLRTLNLQSRKEKCGWCCGCKAPEESEMECLFINIMNDSVNQAAENFTSHALGIRAGEKTKKHLIDVICHIIWIEDRLQGLLSGPWLNPNYSKIWRRFGLEATHIGYLKKMLLQLELNLHRRALSGDWTKNADAAVTMGSASHIVRRSTRVLPVAGCSSSKRKCSNQGVTQTPKDAVGVSLSWWRGGRASRELFNWKVVPRASASKAARQGGCTKIAGVHYPDCGEYAKRMKFTAWRAAVETAKTVEQLALLVRVLEANIKWNDIENVSLLSEKEPRKPVKSFKNVVVRKERREGEKVQYLLDFGKSRLIPNIVVKHGSLVEDCSSHRKKYWLEESHVPLHLLKAFQEKRLLRASSSDAPAELHESSIERVELPQRKKGFEYLFERAESLERTTTCQHCTDTVLIREAVTCQYCKGFFHSGHARESASTSTAEPIYTCQKCWDRNGECTMSLRTPKVQKRRRARRAADPEKVCWNSIIKDFMREEQEEAVPEDLWDIVATSMPKKRRAETSSSYWVKGVHFSRRDDQRLSRLQRKMLILLSGEDAPINEDPKCSLCGELERAANLHYVSCEICGAWFHGDALDLRADSMENIIGFECHKCLNKRPLVCPHQRLIGDDEDAVLPEDSGSEDGDPQFSDDSEDTISL